MPRKSNVHGRHAFTLAFEYEELLQEIMREEQASAIVIIQSALAVYYDSELHNKRRRRLPRGASKASEATMKAEDDEIIDVSAAEEAARIANLDDVAPLPTPAPKPKPKRSLFRRLQDAAAPVEDLATLNRRIRDTFTPDEKEEFEGYPLGSDERKQMLEMIAEERGIK